MKSLIKEALARAEVKPSEPAGVVIETQEDKELEEVLKQILIGDCVMVLMR